MSEPNRFGLLLRRRRRYSPGRLRSGMLLMRHAFTPDAFCAYSTSTVASSDRDTSPSSAVRMVSGSPETGPKALPYAPVSP
jgi:hypothetical protein